MKRVDTKGKDKATIEKEVLALRTKLRDLAFKAAGARADNVKERRQAKKDIARLLTALRALSATAE